MRIYTYSRIVALRSLLQLIYDAGRNYFIAKKEQYRSCTGYHFAPSLCQKLIDRD